MRIVALYGTGSGHAEDVARGIAKAFPERHVELLDMADARPDVLAAGVFYLIPCSTATGGDPPAFAQFLYEDIQELAPDLRGLTYALFGLGDSSYGDTYIGAVHLFDGLLSSLGATRVGPIGEHDEMSSEDHVELGVGWAREVFAALG